jgi:UDP-N-acetylglucosamine kinase
MYMSDENTQLAAIAFAKENRKRVAKQLTDPNKYQPDELPVSVFMAGSPGAGKTEFSKNIISILEKDSDHQVIRIDGDDIRSLLPGYTGDNSHLFQGAVSLVVEKIHDFVLLQKQSFVLDGTFSRYEKAVDNIKRSLDKSRRVFMFYVYQNPETAWRFTKQREKAEGRNIPKESFIDQFFGANETVSRIRREYDERVTVFLVKKDFEKNTVDEVVKIKPNDLIDDYIKERYTKNNLQTIL